MMLLKKITDLRSALLRKKGKQEVMQETKGRAELPFPTTGIIGAIAGDCFGAAYEFHPVKHEDFDIYKEPRFTDDTVMTLAVAKWLTIDPEHSHEKLVECMKHICLPAMGRSFYGGLLVGKRNLTTAMVTVLPCE